MTDPQNIGDVAADADRENVTLDESANGGIMLPVGEKKDDAVEEEREKADFDYSTGEAVPEKTPNN